MHVDAMRVATKGNLHRIEGNNLKASYKNMSTSRILWTTTVFLSYRHRVGLLGLSVVALLAYIAWDKVVRILFF